MFEGFMRFPGIFMILLAFILAGFIGAGYFFQGEIKTEDKNFSQKELLEFVPQENDEVVLFFVGDVMLNRGVEYMVKRHGAGDWRFPFLKIADYLQKADLVFGNLEGPIANLGVKAGSIYSFRADPAAVEGLKFAGFAILSLANNHALDYTREALEQTMEILSANGILYTGAGESQTEAYSAKIIGLKDIKIAFLAFTDLGPPSWAADGNKSGLAWIKDPFEPSPYIKEAKQKTDIVVVSLHSGQEYQKEPTAFQKEFARQAIEAGADLVIQHHSHVIQKVERYKQGWAAYGLGNFVFDQGFSKETMEGLLLEARVKDGKIFEVKEHKIRINQFFQPTF